MMSNWDHSPKRLRTTALNNKNHQNTWTIVICTYISRSLFSQCTTVVGFSAVNRILFCNLPWFSKLVVKVKTLRQTLVAPWSSPPSSLMGFHKVKCAYHSCGNQSKKSLKLMSMWFSVLNFLFVLFKHMKMWLWMRGKWASNLHYKEIVLQIWQPSVLLFQHSLEYQLILCTPG